MTRTRRSFIATAAAAALASAAASAFSAGQGSEAGVLTPEAFGAKGDGRTDDTAAFAALAERINAQRGGIVVLRPVTYLVGRQARSLTPRNGYAFAPATIMRFSECSRGLVIRGNGAVLRCAPGLRYGTFDAATGRGTKPAMPNYARGTLATPYEHMILVERCSGPVTITDLELDGNAASHQIGGQYGDVGWQIPAIGLFLLENTGPERIENLYTHHHLQDGLMISGEDVVTGAPQRLFRNVRSEYNGRQGCSLIGGSGYVFENCRFNHTGRGPISSPPAAGFDIEAEHRPIRNLRFVNCEFSDNDGCGLLADSGDSASSSFQSCRFIGTTMWSVWANKPYFRFDSCVIVGSAVQPFGDPDPRRAAQFHNCTFTDDPSLTPKGAVYRQGRPDGSLADFSEKQNVLMNQCTFRADHGAVLPWSTRAIYQDCNMRQKSRSIGYPRGTYRGRNTIVGNVDLWGSRIEGEVNLNGVVRRS